MVSLSAHAEVANNSGFNLTGTLRHADIVAIAEEWMPSIRFHEKERFHPVDLKTLFTTPRTIFDGLPEPTRDALRITVSGPAGEQRFDPPLVRHGSTVILHGGDIIVDPNSPTDGTEALAEAAVDKESLYTHGDSNTRSRDFFGASDTLNGLPEPTPGDPRVPRHPIEVRAEMRFLLETLKHELQDDRPDDALWGRFDIARLFVLSTTQQGVFPEQAARALLKALIAAHEAGDQAQIAALIGGIPFGFRFNTRAWNAVKNYAFLEFYFFYAYNDFDEYGDWPFENTHEGDVEGCCVVFERRHLDEFASGMRSFTDIVAHTIITSVHEEFNDSDELKRLPVERQDALDDCVVFVAPGSHATYLTVGSHDFTDWEDVITDWPGMLPWWAKLLAALAALHPIGRLIIAAILLLAVAAEHFFGSEDETSDNGASVGPGPDPAPGTTRFPKRMIVTPLSNISADQAAGGDRNLYQAALPGAAAGDGVDLGHLARRAFPGKWGASDGLVSRSSNWQNKTTRYFRKFLSNGEIEAELIT